MTVMTIPFTGPTFTLDVPSNWIIAANPDAQALFTAPDEGLPTPTTMAIMIRNVTPEVQAEPALQQLVAKQQAEYNQYEILNQEAFTISGEDAYAVQTRWYSPENDVWIEQWQAIVGRVPFMYVILLTMPEGTSAEYVEQLYAMRDSFALTEQPERQ